MKKLTIKLNLDERKYDALHTFSTQKGIDIDAEFVAYFEKCTENRSKSRAGIH